jgi:excisionase family DNA binding protein
MTYQAPSGEPNDAYIQSSSAAQNEWARPRVPFETGPVSGLVPLSPDEDELLTTADAANLLKVRESWLRYKVKRREIPCTRPGNGRLIRFSRLDVRDIARMGRQPAKESPPPKPAAPAPRPKRRPGP